MVLCWIEVAKAGILIFEEKLLVFKYDVFYVFFIYGFNYVEWFPFYFVECFYHERMLNFFQMTFCINWYDLALWFGFVFLYYVNVAYYFDCVANHPCIPEMFFTSIITWLTLTTAGLTFNFIADFLFYRGQSHHMCSNNTCTILCHP